MSMADDKKGEEGEVAPLASEGGILFARGRSRECAPFKFPPRTESGKERRERIGAARSSMHARPMSARGGCVVESYYEKKVGRS